MFVVSTHLVRVLLAVSQRGALLQYAPEVRPAGRVLFRGAYHKFFITSQYCIARASENPVNDFHCQLTGGTLCVHISSA